jgi:hypothetical protein
MVPKESEDMGDPLGGSIEIFKVPSGGPDALALMTGQVASSERTKNRPEWLRANSAIIERFIWFRYAFRADVEFSERVNLGTQAKANFAR